MKPPIIEALKKQHEHFNAFHFIRLPTETPYGNLVVNWREIVVRVHNINKQIIQLYNSFYSPSNINSLPPGAITLD